MISSVEDARENNNVNDFKKAIREYEDEYITGLTEEEKEKIREQIAEYKSKNKLETKEDYEALNKFVEGLLQRYGFKGDIEEAAMSFVNSSNALGETNNKNVDVNEVVKVYNQLKDANYRI